MQVREGWYPFSGPVLGSIVEDVVRDACGDDKQRRVARAELYRCSVWDLLPFSGLHTV